MPVCELAPAPHRAQSTPAAAASAFASRRISPAGRAPRGWHRRLLAPMETGIVLRAIAIIFIVSTRIGFFD